MFFSLEVRRAHQGDCLLLHFGSKSKPRLAMIDGGPGGVYAEHLRPRLIELRKARRLGSAEPLPVDLLMVSHVDDDHIRGVLDLTRELTGSKTAPLVEVGSLWHNTFDDIIGNTPKELTAALSDQFGAASLTDRFPVDATLDAAADKDSEVVMSSLKVLASIEQGHRLRDDAERLDIALNPEFDGKLILASAAKHTVAEGLTFIVAGPLQPELQALQKKHDEWLKTQQKNRKAADHALAEYVDESVPNLSSLVVCATVKDKSMLLTGDARGDRILAGLEKARLLSPGKSRHVNVLKVPHHGSSRNVEADFFRRVTADHYVFSGNGDYGNPERETLAMLFAARGNAPFELHFTYPLEEIDAGRKADWRKEQAKEVTKQKQAKGADKQKLRPREDWSDAKHGLTAFFAKTKFAEGQRVRIVEKDKPHLIDLMDPVAF